MPLPVEAALPDLLEALRASPAAILVAPPGSGKTTRVPAALQALAPERRVLVLEPRRLAARWAASFVAAQRGEAVGASVGYQVRFDDRTGPATRLVYCTEGILPRRFLHDPSLAGVSAVVLDEFHERNLPGDLALALLRRLQAGRPDLRVVLMSATLAGEDLAARLGGWPLVQAPGRVHPVEVEHDRAWDPRPLEERVAAAVAEEAPRGRGHLLVFLPGAAEIRRCQAACAPLAERFRLRVLPLHGDLPPSEQDAALSPGPGRKLILSTNVAESSVTIDGVDCVIDSGLARILRHLPGSGLPSLQVERVARASLEQRAGRAGRTGPGRCRRLLTLADLQARPDHEAPAIQREDLSDLLLQLLAMGVDPDGLPWLDPPPPEARERGMALLEALQAVDGGHLSAAGRLMARLPTSPRQARLVAACAAAGRLEEGCELAALLEERDSALGPAPEARPHGRSDLLERWRARPRRGRERADRAARQLRQAWGSPPTVARRPGDDPLQEAILAAFPDRVGRARDPGKSDEVLLASGGMATLSSGSAARGAEWMACLEVQDDPRRGRLIRAASPVDPAWLLEHEGFLDEVSALEWNSEAGRVERVERLKYGALTLHASRAAAPPGPEAGEILLRAARTLNPEDLGATALQTLTARVAALARALPDEGWELADGLDFPTLLRQLCARHSSLRGLRQEGPEWIRLQVLETLGPARAARLDALAPTHVPLAGRRRAPVHYPADQAPWVASRMADFFGLRETPRIAGGRLPLVMHLLAPSGRPVQITSDLAGFWERHWPRIRRELCRRYPKHPWPEDPLAPP